MPIEVEGIRLIGDLVAAGAGLSIVPEARDRRVARRAPRVDRATCRRAASRSCSARGAQLTLADQAVHDVVAHLVRTHE